MSRPTRGTLAAIVAELNTLEGRLDLTLARLADALDPAPMTLVAGRRA
jgi:hypothetical protein